VRIHHGEWLRVPREAPKPDAEAARALLEERLDVLTRTLDAELRGRAQSGRLGG